MLRCNNTNMARPSSVDIKKMDSTLTNTTQIPQNYGTSHMPIGKWRKCQNRGIVSTGSRGLRENLRPLLSELMARLRLKSALRFYQGCQEHSQTAKSRFAYVPICIWPPVVPTVRLGEAKFDYRGSSRMELKLCEPQDACYRRMHTKSQLLKCPWSKVTMC